MLVTGRTDYSTDGRQVTATENGHAMMSRVTGVGCSMGALSAACAAVSPTPLQAAVSTAVLMGLAGEMAFEQSPPPRFLCPHALYLPYTGISAPESNSAAMHTA